MLPAANAPSRSYPQGNPRPSQRACSCSYQSISGSGWRSSRARVAGPASRRSRPLRLAAGHSSAGCPAPSPTRRVHPGPGLDQQLHLLGCLHPYPGEERLRVAQPGERRRRQLLPPLHRLVPVSCSSSAPCPHSSPASSPSPSRLDRGLHQPPAVPSRAHVLRIPADATHGEHLSPELSPRISDPLPNPSRPSGHITSHLSHPLSAAGSPVGITLGSRRLPREGGRLARRPVPGGPRVRLRRVAACGSIRPQEVSRVRRALVRGPGQTRLV